MALGPKAMGEAITANLKAKTGKDLAEWQATLQSSGIKDQAEARQYLRDLGLGRFQSVAVVEHVFGLGQYADEQRLVDDQFVRFPEQRALYDLAVTRLGAERFTPKPCRSYLPVYRDGRIAISFKPTRRGLYAALNVADPSEWPDRVAHKPSLGGSDRLKDGIYISDVAKLGRVLKEVR